MVRALAVGVVDPSDRPTTFRGRIVRAVEDWLIDLLIHDAGLSDLV